MYPFSMYGRIVQIHRFKVTYGERTQWLDEEGALEAGTVERTEYCHTEGEANAVAERMKGSVTELDSRGYEWMDGIEVADVPDTYAEAVKIYEMGSAVWLAQAQEKKQTENNLALAEYLSTHPITWTDGKQYGVSQQDQQEISLNLAQYQLSVGAGLSARLEWHAVHEECREFTQEELTGLAVAISEYVYPLVRKNQAYKAQIYGAETVGELEGIAFDY